MIELDIGGQVVSAPTEAIARLRELAAAQAGRSDRARDLSLVLDRAIRTGATVALHRGEVRALLELLNAQPADDALAPLHAAAQSAARTR